MTWKWRTNFFVYLLTRDIGPAEHGAWSTRGGGQLGAGARRQSVKMVAVWPLHCGASDVDVMSSVIHILWDGDLGKLLINAVRRFQIYSDLKKRVWCVGAGAINYLNSAMHVAWYLVNSGSFRRNYRGDFLNNPPFGWFSINGLKWCSINNVDRSGLELNTILRNNVLQFPIFCFQ